MHVLFQIRPRLIIISFLVDKSPALGISFNEARQIQECKFIQRRSFFFSLCSLCGMTLESGFLPYPKLCVLALQSTNSNWLFPVVWKMTCWLFGSLFLHSNHGCCLLLSADAYMANSEWDSLMTMSPNANRGELKRNGLSTATILGYYYSWLMASVSHLLTPQPGECMRVSYFLVTIYQVILLVWIFLTLSFHQSYYPSLLAGPPNYIHCPHRADVSNFMLLGLYWCVHM